MKFNQLTTLIFRHWRAKLISFFIAFGIWHFVEGEVQHNLPTSLTLNPNPYPYPYPSNTLQFESSNYISPRSSSQPIYLFNAGTPPPDLTPKQNSTNPLAHPRSQ